MRVCPRCASIYVTNVQWCGIDGETLVDQEQDPLVGRAIERYEVVERLGMGGMGCVYRAKHAVIDREYAIKVLYGDFAGDDKFRARFKREAQSISKIRHPNIVQVEDFGTTQSGLTFLAMELVRGRTLEAVINREAPLSPIRTANITRQIAAGLEAAHVLGFVHRDVKPSNVMLMKHEEFEGEFVKILDFGTVSLREIPTSERLTSIGHIIGTPTYMAPEQSQDPGVAPTADVYSLGCIMFEMLAGEPPFVGSGRAEVMVKHITEAPPPAPPSRGLEILIGGMLTKVPAKRPQSCAAIVEAIEALNFGLPELPEAARPKARSSARSNPLAEAKVDNDAFFSAPTNHMMVDLPQDAASAAPTPPSDPPNFEPFPSIASNVPGESGEWEATWSAGAEVGSTSSAEVEVAFRNEGHLARAVDALESETSVSPSDEINEAVREVQDTEDVGEPQQVQKHRSTLIVRQRDKPAVETSDLTIQPDPPTDADDDQVLFEPERPSKKPPSPEDDAGPTQVDFSMDAHLERRPILVPTESLQAVSFLGEDSGDAPSTMDTVPPNDLDADTPEDHQGDEMMGTAPTNPVALRAPPRPPTPISMDPNEIVVPSSDASVTVLNADQIETVEPMPTPDLRLPSLRAHEPHVDDTPVPPTVDGVPAIVRSAPPPSIYPIAIVAILLLAALLGALLLFGTQASDPVELQPNPTTSTAK